MKSDAEPAVRHHAIIRVPRESLAEALRLPPGTVVLGVSDQVYFFEGSIALKVSHPDLKPSQPGDSIPLASPRYSRSNGEDQVAFVGWGQ